MPDVACYNGRDPCPLQLTKKMKKGLAAEARRVKW